jgi:TolB-like protein
VTREAAGIERLSARQREILELAAKGLTNEEIAGVLHIAPATVRTHMSQVLARLELTNRTEAAAAYAAWAARPEKIAVVLERPAIAVLPIEAFDEEPVTRAVAWGLTHDLAALFARWCWFPVIAPAATVGAPASGETTQSVGQRLGARFLVAAALRTGMGPWRLIVRIVEADSGRWIWTDRFEFTPAELFAVQDTVCATIVANAYPVIVAHTEVALRGRLGAVDLTAWELAHQGMRLQASREADTNATAQGHFRAALAREPGLVLAHFGLGLCGFDDLLNQRRPREEAMELLYECAQRCVGLAPHAAEGYYLVRLAVTAADGRSGSAARTISVRDRDVAVTKLTAPQVARAGQTRQVSVGVTGKRYDNWVSVILFKSDPSDPSGYSFVGELRQFVATLQSPGNAV